MFYRPKLKLEAILYTGENLEEIKKFCGNDFAYKRIETRTELDNFGLTEVKYEYEYYVRWAKLNIGDYVIKDRITTGMFSTCKAAIFETTYEEVK